MSHPVSIALLRWRSIHCHAINLLQRKARATPRRSTSKSKNKVKLSKRTGVKEGSNSEMDHTKKPRPKELQPRRNTLVAIDEVTAEKMILYKDRDIIALNKPSGLAVHSGPKMKTDLSQYLHYWQDSEDDQPPELAHRLDKDTSGVLLLTRHQDAARRLAELFKERKIIKKYWAITVNVPDELEGVIQIPLSTKNIATKGNMTRVVLHVDQTFSPNNGGAGSPGGPCMAETEYCVLSVSSRALKRCCLMEVKPVTGFRHQIRVHLADGLMCPIFGDHKFAGPVFRASPLLKKKVEAMNCPKSSPLHLHAREIVIPGSFVGKRKPLIIKAIPPGHFIRTAREQGLDVGLM